MAELKPEDLAKIEEVSQEELESITGGKSAMPMDKLQGYRLLKIADPAFQPSAIQDTLKKR